MTGKNKEVPNKTIKNKEKTKYGGGYIWKTADGRYRGEIYMGTDPETGKKRPKKIFTSKNRKIVEEKMDLFLESEVQYRKKYKKNTIKKELNNNPGTLEYELIKWMHLKKLSLKPKSYARNVSTAKCHIFPNIGEYAVEDLTVDLIQDKLINRMTESGASFSAIKKAKDLLSGFYKYYLVHSGKYMTNINIIKFIELPKRLKKEEQVDETKYMTDDETMRFIEECTSVCENGKPKYKRGDLILLLLNTGMRVGECIPLRVMDFNKENKTLRINKNAAEVSDADVGRDQTRKNSHSVVLQNTPKTSKGNRIIPLNQTAMDILEKASGNKKPNDLLFPNSRGGLLWTTGIRKTVNGIYRKIGCDGKSGLHTLRHTYASALFHQSVPTKIIQRLLGHNSAQITSDIYTHIIDELIYGVRKQQFKPYPEHLKQYDHQYFSSYNTSSA